uniref:small cell adhesion glycoprotein-like n=1 Tax=Pristiophorus japonicus TaxID=55135 RepID=UPI00398E8F65
MAGLPLIIAPVTAGLPLIIAPVTAALPLTIAPVTAGRPAFNHRPDGHGLMTTTTPEAAGSDTAIIAGVITAVVISVLCLAALLFRYMYRQKGNYITYEQENEPGTMSLQIEDTLTEEQKEYFI